MNRIRGTSRILGIVALAVLALAVVPALAAPAHAGPVVPANATSQQWAYGGAKWVNTTVDLPNATLTSHAFFGWDVVFTATNTSTTVQAWEAQRTMAGSLAISFTSKLSSGNFTLRALETDTGFANLTTAASVYENGTAVPAVGLLNASFENAANLTASQSFTLAVGPFAGTATSGFLAEGSAHGAVSLAPALGLVPLNLTPGTDWNSSSTYTAAGAWSVLYSLTHTGFNGSTMSSNATVSGMLNATGPIAVFGSDAGTLTLANGHTVPVVAVGWTGPFDVVDGVILIPHDFDLFGDGGHPWSSDDLGSENVATANLDLGFGGAHGPRFVAAASGWGSAATSLPVENGNAPAPGPAALAAPASPTVVQAQPEPVAQAQQNAACLTGGCASASPARGLVALEIGLGVVGAVVAAVVGLVLYLRSRGGRGGSTQAPAPVPAGATWEPTGPRGP